MVKGEGTIVDKEVGEEVLDQVTKEALGPSADNDIWAVVWIGIDTS